jgi:hypothetical protein
MTCVLSFGKSGIFRKWIIEEFKSKFEHSRILQKFLRRYYGFSREACDPQNLCPKLIRDFTCPFVKRRYSLKLLEHFVFAATSDLDKLVR